MKHTTIFPIVVLFCSHAFATNLCLTNEKTIFSFETKTKKYLSICKEKNGNYLVYRFGKVDNIELQFPSKLDNTSWNAFEFSGMRRPGGKLNAGFGDYSLAFGIQKVGYTVFQEWSDEDETYSIGVIVSGKVKPVTIHGLKETQEGSLVLLDEEKNLPNIAK